MDELDEWWEEDDTPTWQYVAGIVLLAIMALFSRRKK